MKAKLWSITGYLVLFYDLVLSLQVCRLTTEMVRNRFPFVGFLNDFEEMLVSSSDDEQDCRAVAT